MCTGEIRWAKLPMNKHHVQGGHRPVLILCNILGEKYSPTINVVPLSTKMNKARRLPTHVTVSEMERESYIMVENIMTISKDIIDKDKVLYRLNKEQMKQVFNAIKLQLGFVSLTAGKEGSVCS